jgi:poly(hydroxyalkanoate) depolymerase family esterase
MRLTLLGLAMVALLSGCAIGTGPDLEAGVAQESFGSNPGELGMYKYIPDQLPPSPAMVVSLHHCFQHANDYIEEVGWKPLADRYKFVLLMPEQSGSNDLSLCFSWYAGKGGQGEVESIHQMVEKMVADYGIDRRRIFITGLSSGGSMTLRMLALYPDVFAGGGAIGAVTFGCTSIALGVFPCQWFGESHEPQEWGDMVREASAHHGSWPIVSIWHGDVDKIAVPHNARSSVEQWTNVHGTDATPDKVETTDKYVHYVYDDAGGRPVVEYWVLTSYGHSVPIDAARGCGIGRDGVGDFVADIGLCSSFEMLKFWGLVPQTETLSSLGPG